MARNHRAGGEVEHRLTRLGELLCGRHSPEGVSCSRQLRSDAVAPVVTLKHKGSSGVAGAAPILSCISFGHFGLVRLQLKYDHRWRKRGSSPRSGCGKSARPVRERGLETESGRTTEAPPSMGENSISAKNHASPHLTLPEQINDAGKAVVRSSHESLFVWRPPIAYHLLCRLSYAIARHKPR